MKAESSRQPSLPSDVEVAHIPHRHEPGASDNLAIKSAGGDNSLRLDNETPRYSFRYYSPPFSAKNMAIADLAIRHLKGEALDIAKAQETVVSHRLTAPSPEQLLSAAICVAEGPIGQAAKQFLNPDRPRGAWESIVVSLQTVDYEMRLKQEKELDRERYGPFPLLGKLLEKLRQLATQAKGKLATEPEIPSPLALPPPEDKRVNNKTVGIPSTPSSANSPPANRYSPEEWMLLKTVPWNHLTDSLKIKTIRFHDDPASRERNPDDPVFPQARTPPSVAARDFSPVSPETLMRKSAVIDIAQIPTSIKWRYSPDELELLVKTPWMDLPVDLKQKTVRLGHHPFEKILNSEVPPFYPILFHPRTAAEESPPLATSLPPTPKPAISGSPGTTTSKPLPSPPYLIVDRVEILRALTMIHKVGQPRRTDQIIFSFDGGYLHFDMPGMTTAGPAQGVWDCQVRAKPAFVHPLIQVPLAGDSWIICIKEGRLYFGPSFSCPCDLQDPWRANIQLPLDSSDDMLLALSLKYTAQEIEQSGLRHSVAKIEELCMRNVYAAAQNLTAYGVKAEEIRPLINQHLRSSGILDKI